jgi:hypothetical protein
LKPPTCPENHYRIYIKSKELNMTRLSELAKDCAHQRRIEMSTYLLMKHIYWHGAVSSRRESSRTLNSQGRELKAGLFITWRYSFL